MFIIIYKITVMDKSIKNKQISDTIRTTYEKRKNQICKTFKFKVDLSSLSNKQKEQLKMQFVEAKWIYNYILSQEDIFSFDYKNLSTITHKDKYGNDITVTLSYIGSSLKQSLIKQIESQIKGLSVLKKKGHTVGKLKFKSEINSIDLKQYDNTHSIRGKKIKIQGIKKPIRVNGLNQLSKYNNLEYANGKLLYDGNDYFISLTCFIDKENNISHTYKNDVIGIDMGISSTITLSDGKKYNISIDESERLKKLQAKLDRQKKGSNNRYKTISKIRKEYNHMTNKKNDISNKIVSSILKENKVVVMQDEQIDSWKEGEFACSKIQHSVLGRIKSKLFQSDRVIILDKWFPTTKYCSNCGHKYDDIKLNERIFICPVCKKKEDRDIHASKNMIYFYQEYNKLDRSGMDQTSIKGPVKISYNKFVSKTSKQEDITL